MEDNQTTTVEESDIEIKDRRKTSTRPRKSNKGKGVEHTEMKYGGKKYGTQFTRNEKINYQ